MAIGSVITSVFIIPRARSRCSPQRLTTYADASFIVVCLLMATIRWSKMFLVIAALAGVGFTLSSTEIWIAGQRAMPDWARGRMNATMIMVSEGALALGSLVWGTTAANLGLVTPFLAAAGLALIAMIVTRLPPFRLSINFTADLNLEPAPATIFSNSPPPLPEAQEGPLSITTKFRIDTDHREEFLDLTSSARLIYLRHGAYAWHLREDLAEPNRFEMEVIVPSWAQHLRRHERMTKDEVGIIHRLYSLHRGPNPPEELTCLHLDKEVLGRAARSGNSS
jgi:hypothetical protein